MMLSLRWIKLNQKGAIKEEETANPFRRTHEPILSWPGSTSVKTGMMPRVFSC
jgi:hypothetical protein